VAPPAGTPRSEGPEREQLSVESDAPRLVTGLRARLTGVYTGLSDRLSRWLDRSEEVKVANVSEDDRTAEGQPQASSEEATLEVPGPEQRAASAAGRASERSEG
jgi:hypothetical protein